MSNDEHKVDEFTFRFTEAMQPAVKQATAIIARPYRRALLWLAVACLLLAAASVVQWWVIP